MRLDFGARQQLVENTNHVHLRSDGHDQFHLWSCAQWTSASRYETHNPNNENLHASANIQAHNTTHAHNILSYIGGQSLLTVRMATLQ